MWEGPGDEELLLLANDLGAAAPAPIKPSEIVALANSLTSTSQETSSQNYPAKQLPDSWPSEIVWENKCLSFQATKFQGNLLHSNR